MPGSMAWPRRPAAFLSSPIGRTRPSSSAAAWWSPRASTRSSISPSPSPDQTLSLLRGEGGVRGDEQYLPQRILHSVDLFDSPVSSAPAPPAPLADRMRPRSLDEVVGQQHLIGPGKVLRRSLEDGRLHSMI